MTLFCIVINVWSLMYVGNNIVKKLQAIKAFHKSL